MTPHLPLQTEGLPSLLVPDVPSVGILLLPLVPASFCRPGYSSSRRFPPSVPVSLCGVLLCRCGRAARRHGSTALTAVRLNGRVCLISREKAMVAGYDLPADLFFWGKSTASFSSSLPSWQQRCNSHVRVVPLEFRCR